MRRHIIYNMDKIIIGQISKPQGIKGEVKVNPLTGDITRFLKLKEIYLENESNPRAVRGCRIASNSVLMYIDGILTRNDAELARGKNISIDKTDAIPLKEGEYFISDIIGCKIYGDNVYLGTVTEVLSYGAADVYQAEKEGKKFMFPFIKALNANVDIKNKTITLDKQRFSEVASYED